MSRWKAASIHLSISIMIGLLVGVLVYGVWYPPPYFHAAGADRLVVLLVGANIVLGPLLTSIVFKSGKRGLKLDLAIIALVQSAALIYGMSVVLSSRPVFLVGAIDRFTLVSAGDIEPTDLAKGNNPEFRTLSWTGPRTVAAELPESPEKRSDMLFASLGGKDIEYLPKYYVSYPQAVAGLLDRAKPLDAIPGLDEAAKTKLDEGVRATGKVASDLVWLPTVAPKVDLVMLMDRASGTPLRAVPIDPWPPLP